MRERERGKKIQVETLYKSERGREICRDTVQEREKKVEERKKQVETVYKREKDVSRDTVHERERELFRGGSLLQT